MKEYNLDTGRECRTGFPEVILAEGKEGRVPSMIRELVGKNGFAIATRVSPELGERLQEQFPEGEHRREARTFIAGKKKRQRLGKVGIITAGTSDTPVAEEARAILECFGAEVIPAYDIGVAGVHRAFPAIEKLKQEKVRLVIVVAGMEGALPSLVSGLIDVPVLAVPTSVGYGSSFGGLSALLGMLNTCSPGIAVFNIDNGFGAAVFAVKLLK